MRQSLPKISIRPSSRHGTQQSDQHHRKTTANLGKKRPRTSPGDRPTQAEKQAAENLAFVKFFVIHQNLLTVHRFQTESFDDLHRNQTHDDRRADDTVHVKRGELKHFLDAKPTHDFGFYESDAEENADGQVFEIVPPRMLDLAFVGAHRILVAHVEFGIWIFHFKKV